MISGVVLNTYGTLAYFFCQWLLTVLVARMNGYTDAGVFSLAISFANIFSYIELWGIRNFQISDINHEYSNGAYAGARVISTVLALVLFPPVLFLYGYTREVAICCVIAVFFKTAESVTDLFFGVMQRLERYDWIAVSYTLKGMIPSVAFLVMLALDMPLVSAMFIMCLSYVAVMLLYDVIRLRGSGIFHLEFRNNLKLFKICFPLMINGLISAYLVYLPRNAVQQIIGSAELGYYSSISTVVVVLSTLVGSVWAALMPTISELVYAKDIKKLRGFFWRILLMLVVIAVLVLVVGNLLGPSVFALIYGKEILSHMDLLTPVLLNAVFLMIDAFFDCFFIPMGKRTSLLFCNGAGFLFCAVTVQFATRIFGSIGACCSMTAGLILRFILLFVSCQYHFKRLQFEAEH